MPVEELPTENPSLPDRQSSAAQHALGVRRAREITRRASTTFYVASCFLPAAARRAVWTVYAFCRTTDDLVDTSEQDARRIARLEAWRGDVAAALDGARHDAILSAFAQTVDSYGIAHEPVFALIDGVRCDIERQRYATFDELCRYCDLVAATVGHMILPILGMLDDRAQAYATKLGRAMQMTNILRDIGEDAALGRIYLPSEDLARFGLGEDDILAGRISERFIEMMRFQIARTRDLYAAAVPGVALVHPRSRYTVRLAIRLYGDILTRIEARRYDVFSGRAHVPNGAKVIMAMQERLRRTSRVHP